MTIGDPICPDCGKPLSSHELYEDGRCPVVRFPAATGELVDLLDASFGEDLPEAVLEICPRCGHTDDQHDEAGCYVCGCPGP